MMKSINIILQFIEIFLYAVLILTLYKRVICRGRLSWVRFKILLNRGHYISDLFLLGYSLLAFFNITNKLLNYPIDPINNVRTIFWETMHIILCTGLLIRFKSSKPIIIQHLQEDIYNFFKNLFKGNFNNNMAEEAKTNK